MISNTTGGYNTAVGHNSLYSNNTGVQNSAFGYSALFDLSGASVANNTGIGYNTGRGITTGVNNTIVGANVTGLAAGTTGVVILATGDGVIRADYGKTTAAVWSLASPIKSAVYTVGTLPSAASATAGARAFVTDALAPSYGATVAGGGAVNIPVYSDGTNWKVG